jgi:hypothetical protein
VIEPTPPVIELTPPAIPAPAPAVEQAAPHRSKTARTSARFPRTVLDRSQEEALEAAKWKLITKGIGKPHAVFEPIKVRQATFDALHPKDRPLFKVVCPSDPSSSSSSSGDESMNDQLDGAPTSGSSPSRKKGLPLSGWPKNYAYPRETVKTPAPVVEAAPEFVQRVLLLVRPLPPSSVNGSCLFDSISRGLEHILKHDLNAFGACSSRSASEAIRALTDPATLRSLICDHLEGPFADMPLECLLGQSPRRAVLEDYVAHGCPLVDAEWVPPKDNPQQPHQVIRNYDEYIAAMRKSSACGDEICLAASADLLGLRHVIFDTRDRLILGAVNERTVDLSLDLTPENLLFELRANRIDRRLSSRMPLFLLRTGAHFDWMHCQSDGWNEPEDESLEHVVAEVFNPFLEIRNPGGFEATMHPGSRSTTRHHRATPDSLMRPLPCKAILEKTTQRRLRSEVLLHMITDLGVSIDNAEAVLLLFERENCVTGGRRHASMRHLPDLMRLVRVIDTNVDPLASNQPLNGPGYASPHGHGSTCSQHSPHKHDHLGSAERRARAKLLETGKRMPPATGPRPDRFGANQPGTFRERVNAATRPYSDFDSAVTALMTTANVSSEVSAAALRRHLVEGISPLGEPLRRAFTELSTPVNQGGDGPLLHPSPYHIAKQTEVDQELSSSRAEFIAKHLKNDTRVMTASEIMAASKKERTELYTGAAAPIIPLNLEKYWRHHQGQILLTPRGQLPMAEYQRRIRALSADALHQEACTVAERRRAAIRQVINENEQTKLAKLDAEQAEAEMREAARLAPAPVPVYAANAPVYDAPERAPQTTNHHSSEFDMSTPASAVHAQVNSFSAPERPRASSLLGAPATLPANSSPAVCLARDREQRRSAAEGKQQIQIVVDTGMLPANSIIWKQGLETDGAGFNYHAFSGVKASWEQANTDKAKSYHSFKSFIDARFISTICSYIGVARNLYESTSDAELLQMIEAKLKPKDSTVYFVKINSFRISSAPTTPKDTLTMRYTAFADKFLATVNEAAEAGTPLLEETIKSAFKTACGVNTLLKMWIGAQKWTTVQATHQLIFGKLQTFEAHSIIKSLSESTGIAPAAPADQVLAQPAAQPLPPVAAPAQPLAAAPVQPRPHYTPEQRRAYAHQQQQGLAQQQNLQLQQQQQQFAQQQQQQQIMVNTMQQSVDSALQRLGQVHQQNPSQMHYAAPPAQTQLPAQMQYTAPIAQAQSPAQMQFASPMFSPPASVNYVQQNALASPHPGLDTRGPNWHVHGPHLGCRSTPCGSTLFCQGCGMHGHSSADCRRTRNPRWNAQGYFSDRYPGAGALQYEARPVQQAYQQPAPPPVQPQVAAQQPRIPPPPFQQQLASASFPTPHRMNTMQRTAPPATASPVTVNASTQAAAGGGAAGA